MEQKESVVVLFNGGIHSAIAAYLLKQQGYKVIGLGINFSKISQKNDPSNCFPINLEKTAQLAKKLDLSFYAVQADALYEHYVVDPMVEARMVGYSSNPILNATKVLFDLLIQKAEKLGVKNIATGHRCRIRFNKITNEYYLEQNKANGVIHSQFFTKLHQEHLTSLLFPLSDLSEEMLNQVAKVAGIDREEVRQFHGQNFVEKVELLPFYSKQIPPSMREEGEIIDQVLDINLGSHDGVYLFHLGMEKIIDKNGYKLDRNFAVVKIEAAKNNVYVSKDILKTTYKSCSIVKFHSYLNLDESKPLKAFAVIQGFEGFISGFMIYKNNSCALFQFDEPFSKLLVNGFSIAIYEKRNENFLLLGGGMILLTNDNVVDLSNDSLDIDNESNMQKKKLNQTLRF